MKIQEVNIDDIIPYAKNPRQNDEAISKVASSLKEFGWRQPIVVDKEMVVIAGHTRLAAARRLNYKKVPIHIATDLTENQIKAYRIADNRVGQQAKWDEDLLSLELKDLQLNGYDLEQTGFDDEELDALLAEAVTEGLVDEDQVPPEPEEATSVLGDVWLLGDHRVMCGDSTSIDAIDELMNNKKADMIFTDPPYGISFKDNNGNKILNDNLNDKKLLEFNKLWQENCYLISSNDCFLLAWQSPRKFHLLNFNGSWKFFRLITMYKSNRISFPHAAWINKTEPCCIFVKGNPKPTKENYLDDCYVYKHDKESHKDSNVGHPTPKPVKMIIENICACIKKNQLAVDIFGGSGSTLLACEKTNRICYTMELDPIYVDVIIQRWQDFTGKKAIHEKTNKTFDEMKNGSNNIST